MERATPKISIIGKLSNSKTIAGQTHGRSSTVTNRNGFTLLELIIVCVLIGTMLVVSVPSMRNSFIGDQLKTTSRKIIGFVNGIRQLAEREHQSYFLNIDKMDNRIWYEKDITIKDAEEDEEPEGLIFPAEIRISKIWTKSEGEYSDDQHRIWISSKGYMDQAVLHLEDDGNNVISLHFFPFLDSVKVYDKYTPGQ